MGFIGFALLAFIIGDYAKRGNSHTQMNIGEVDGEVITNKDFNIAYERNADYVKAQQRKNSLTAQESFRVRQQTWDQMVRTILMDKEFAELHIEVSSEELSDMVTGPNPNPAIVQNFTNPQTGEFDVQIVKNYVNQMANAPAEQRLQWNNFLQSLVEQQKNIKFDNLISKAYYVPNGLAKLTYNDDNTKAKFRYVAARYSDVADSLAVPTESDYKKYYDEHKALYEQDATRDLEYVIFNVNPSQDDKEKLAKEMNEIYNEMKEIDIDAIPSFVNANSDVNYDSSWMKKAQVPVQIDALITEGQVGEVSKPYFTKGSFFVSELMGKEMRSDSLKASHILIAYQGALRANPDVTRTPDQAKALADSLFAVIKKSPKKFDELAKDFSNGPTASKAGDLGWFTDGQMVPAFNSFVQDGKVNQIGVVPTQFGYHVIKVTGKNKPAESYRIATVERKLAPSDRTYQKTFQEASSFAVKSNDLASFNNTVKEGNFNKRNTTVRTSSAYIAGIESPREIVRWAFNEKTQVGTVSNVFEDDSKYIVAVVSKKIEKGVLPFEDAIDRFKGIVINQKKGEILAAKMTASDIYEVAKEVNTSVEDVNSITFASRNIPGFGMENKVIGEIFKLKEGELSKPIIGNAATFVIQVEKVTPAPEAKNLDGVKTKLEGNFQRRVGQGYVFKALENTAEIQDNRVTFY